MGEGFSELLNDPEYNDAIDVLASHSYKGKDATDQNIIDWAQNVAKFPEKEAWMTEYCTAGNQMGDLEIDRAIEAMRILTSRPGVGRYQLLVLVAWMGSEIFCQEPLPGSDP